MSVMYVLLPACLVFAAVAVLVFVWAARSGQFDDLETPALRVLGEEDAGDGSAPEAAAGVRPTSSRDRASRAHGR